MNSQLEKYIEAYLRVKNRLKISFMGQYYQPLFKVDFEVTQKFYPVNIAFHKTIALVLAYYSYQKVYPE